MYLSLDIFYILSSMKTIKNLFTDLFSTFEEIACSAPLDEENCYKIYCFWNQSLIFWSFMKLPLSLFWASSFWAFQLPNYLSYRLDSINSKLVRISWYTCYLPANFDTSAFIVSNKLFIFWNIESCFESSVLIYRSNFFVYF